MSFVDFVVLYHHCNFIFYFTEKESFLLFDVVVEEGEKELSDTLDNTNIFYGKRKC